MADNGETPEKQLYPNCDSSVWLRSCEEEVVQPIKGIIQGTIPKWINGSLLRNGPGSLKVGKMEFKHLFDSSALLHRFAISNGEVTYQCRFLQSDTYKKNTTANRIVVTEFGTKAIPDPCHSIFDRFSAFFNPGDSMSDNAMISVYPFGDEIYTFTESPIIHRIDPETLDTLGKRNISKQITIANHTSHPHVMPNGDVYNLGMTVTKKGISYGVLFFPAADKDRMFEEAQILTRIPARWSMYPGYMHTFGITDKYYVIVEQPLSVSLYRMVKAQIKNSPMASCLRWYPDHCTLLHVVKRSDGCIKKTFYTEAFFYLHIVNQYEEDDHIIIDICCYRDPSVLEAMYVDSMRTMQSNINYANMFRSRPMRFVLPLHGTEITLQNTASQVQSSANGHIFVVPELLCDIGCETPKIHYEKYLGKKYRFFYAIGSDVDSKFPGLVIKVDTINKTKVFWSEENCYPSEPIFVASPNSKEEDDGVVLSALVWGRSRKREVGLLVLNAKDLTEIGRATFVTPSDAPKCLHGWFLPHAPKNIIT